MRSVVALTVLCQSLAMTSGFAVAPSSFSRLSSSSRLFVAVEQEEGAEDVEVPLQTEEERLFLEHCKVLCDERNFPLCNVKNARDLASIKNSPVKPNRVLRMGRVSDASDEDIELLFNEIGIKTLVDLRSPTELKDDPTLEREAVFKNFTSLVWSERGRGKDGCLRELKPGEPPVRTKKKSWRNPFGRSNNNNNPAVSPLEALEAPAADETLSESESTSPLEVLEASEQQVCNVCDDGYVPAKQLIKPDKDRKERYFVSLMNEFKYVKGTLSKLRKRDIARAVLKSPGALVSRRVRSNIKKPFLDEINDGGLPMLNELLMRFGAPGIKYVLDLVADKSNHPIVFYCTAGKDRTGMIAAVILSMMGASDEDIVEDYTLSANVYAEMNDHKAMVGALSQRNLDPKTFLCAPPQVMRDTLQALREDYGSIEGYLDWIGFGPEDQKKLRDALSK